MKFVWTTVFIVMNVACWWGRAEAVPTASIDFAIYAPGQPGDGVWPAEVRAVTDLLDHFGWTWMKLNARQIQDGVLQSGRPRFHGLIMPGGSASPRIKAIGSVGKSNIDQFIHAGGHYIGFCAGSYYATEKIVWAESSSGTYNAQTDYHPIAQELGLRLFKGIAQGPFGWTPWKSGAIADGLETTEINLANPTMKRIGMPSLTKLFYYGGPFLEWDQNPKNLEVWARARSPRGTLPAAATGDGQATIARYRYGKGNVILFSYHPLIILGGVIHGVKVQQALTQPVQNQDPFPFAQDDVNLQSWNLLHAALQIASNQSVTPLTFDEIKRRFKTTLTFAKPHDQGDLYDL